MVKDKSSSKKKAGFLRGKLIWILMGFLLGWLGTHYIVETFYPITGCICILGLHFHHLYIGFIIAGMTFLSFFLIQRRYKLSYEMVLVFYFFIGLGLGMAFDDAMTHWILQTDPFEFWCGEYC